MVRMKPSFDGSDETERPEGMFYDGPPPRPGMYTGVVEKLGLAKIGSGDNKGQDRLALLVRITEGPFEGAGVFHSLNMTKQGGYYVNQFLWAMTNGTQRQKDAIRKMFWHKGYDVAKEADGKMGHPITVIGSKFEPIKKKVQFITVMDNDLEGNPRAKIARFLIPVAAEEEPDEFEESLPGPESGSGIDEFAPETTKNPEPEPEKPTESDDFGDELESIGAAHDTSSAVDLDDDDPWA